MNIRVEMDDFLRRMETVLKRIHAQFDELDKVRERCFEISRKLVRQSGIAIKHIHRMELDEARAMLSEAMKMAKELSETISKHTDAASWGFVHDAQRELSEAVILFSIVSGEKLPEPYELNVCGAAYIHGLAEAMSEVRRLILDGLNRGAEEDVKTLLRIVEEAYYLLLTFDHPDTITLGLRRKVDQLRLLLERTHSDVAIAFQCSAVISSLREHSKSLKSLNEASPAQE
jgi:translin